MIRKNHPTSLKPDSTMGRVFSCVANGIRNKAEISKETGLRIGQVKSALYNLVFIGLLRFCKSDGAAVYYTTDEQMPNKGNSCFANVNSIFNVNRFTN